MTVLELDNLLIYWDDNWAFCLTTETVSSLFVCPFYSAPVRCIQQFDLAGHRILRRRDQPYNKVISRHWCWRFQPGTCIVAYHLDSSRPCFHSWDLVIFPLSGRRLLYIPCKLVIIRSTCTKFNFGCRGSGPEPIVGTLLWEGEEKGWSLSALVALTRRSIARRMSVSVPWCTGTLWNVNRNMQQSLP